jgi:VWFA-related protein
MQLLFRRLLPLLLAMPLFSQQTSQPETTIKSSTRVVVLDVVVTDKNGNRVPGLEAKDFQVLEDGVPQSLASFTLEDHEKIAPAPAHAEGFVSNFESVAADKEPPVVLVMDESYMAFADQAYARHEVLAYLKKFEPSEPRRIAIFALNSRLELVHDFTSDISALTDAMKTHVAYLSATNTNFDSDDDNFDPSSILAGSFGPTITDVRTSLGPTTQDEYSAQLTRNVYSNSMMGLRTIATLLEHYPGRKTLIWISSGFPDLTQNSALFGESRQFSDFVRDTANLLASARITVYPVDPRGLVGAFAGTKGRRANTTAIWASQGPMVDIADMTGGFVHRNLNDVDAGIAKAAADNREYYAVSYSPSNKKWDGKFRKIEVKVDRRDVKVRTRRGYYALEKEKEEQLKDVSKDAAAAFWNPLESTGIPIQARIAHLPNDPRPVLQLLLGPSGLNWKPMEKTQTFPMKFAVAEFDRKGRSLQMMSQQFDVTLTEDRVAKAMKDGVSVAFHVQPLPRTDHLRLLVQDASSGTIGTLDIPVAK